MYDARLQVSSGAKYPPGFRRDEFNSARLTRARGGRFRTYKITATAYAQWDANSRAQNTHYVDFITARVIYDDIYISRDTDTAVSR